MSDRSGIRLFTRRRFTAEPEPEPEPEPPVPKAECEAVRREHVNTESTLRALGALLVIGSMGFAWIGTSLLGYSFGDGAVLLAVGGVAAVGGARLWQLRADARVYVTAVAAAVILSESRRLIDMLEHPLRVAQRSGSPTQMVVVVLVLGFVLWVLWSRRASTVLTEHYRTVVITGSPTVRFNATPVMVLFLVLLGAALVAAVVRAWMS